MASVSPEVKVNLFQRLENIRKINYALQFCDLLIEAKKMLEDEVKLTSKQDQIFDGIRRLLENVSVVELVDTIFKPLKKHEKASRNWLHRRLVNLLKSESEHSENLGQLIEVVESMIDLILSFNNLITCCYSYCYEKKKRKLDTLKKILFILGKKEATHFLSSLYWLCLSEIDFTCEERKQVGDLVVKAMPYCKTFIIDSCMDINNPRGIIQLKIRSEMQFIRDLLAEYSDVHGVLEEFIKNLDHSMVRLDTACNWSENHLKNVLLGYDGDDPVYYVRDEFCGETLERFYDCGASFVPKEHTWWEKFRKANY